MAASNTVLDQFDQQMLDLMNGARATAGAPALTAAPGLRTLALGWSTFMADGGTGGLLQHNPNVRAQLPTNGAASATAWAENVASWSPGTGQDAASVFGLYMNSPGHRANILNPTMRFVGTGTVISAANVGFNTMNFTNAIDPVAPPSATPPFGNYDSATVSGSSVVVVGWALDPTNKALSIPVHVYINDVLYPVPTTVARPDVNSIYGATGPHGFSAVLPLQGGSNVVCVYAISSVGAGNPSFGCRTVVRNPPATPVGYLDSVTVAGRNVVVSGWTVDPADTSHSARVQIDVGSVSRVFTANSARPDVNAALSITGNHGFSKTLSIARGVTRVCVWAVSVSGDAKAGIACSDVFRS